MTSIIASDAYLNAIVWGFVALAVIVCISELVRAWRNR